MASQVLSGSSNVSYTNNTGQNVRVIINFMRSYATANGFYNLTISWSGGSISAPSQMQSAFSIGRNLAFLLSSGVNNTTGANFGAESGNVAFMSYPTELMLAPGQTFSATCGLYNVVVIPEAG